MQRLQIPSWKKQLASRVSLDPHWPGRTWRKHTKGSEVICFASWSDTEMEKNVERETKIAREASFFAHITVSFSCLLAFGTYWLPTGFVFVFLRRSKASFKILSWLCYYEASGPFSNTSVEFSSDKANSVRDWLQSGVALLWSLTVQRSVTALKNIKCLVKFYNKQPV